MVKRILLPLLILALVPGGKALAKVPSPSPEGGFALTTPAVSSPEFERILAAGEKGFLFQTGYPASAHPPVVVVLRPDSEQSGSLPRLSVDALEGGSPKIMVELRRADMTTGASQLLVSSLMLREYYGDHAPVPGSRVPQYPPWVIRGLVGLCFPPAESVRIPSGYLKGGSPPTLEDFLVQRPPERESTSLGDLYDAMASLLMKAGLSTSTGRQAFRDWIGHDDPSHVTSRWVSGWEMGALERRWLLLMAGNSTREEGVAKLQNVAASVKGYDDAMSEMLKGSTIASLSKERTGAYPMGNLSSRLQTLRFQANPMVMPLIDQTILLLSKARKLPVNKISDEEMKLTQLRRTILRQSEEIEAYLDWYEAAKVPLKSGQFERLLQQPGTLSRKGPIGRYLDAVEARGW
jgi:hypothetical protein